MNHPDSPAQKLPVGIALQTELLAADGSVCARGYLTMKENSAGNFYPKQTLQPDAVPAQVRIVEHGTRAITEFRKSAPGRMTEFHRLVLG